MKAQIDQRLADALRSVLESVDGRFFLCWLIFDVCKLVEGSFHTNALVNAHLTGRQAVGRELFHLLSNVAPEFLIVLLKERILVHSKESEDDSVLKELEKDLMKGWHDE